MIKNYFLLFIRNLARQKVFSGINLLGLTVSLASTLLISLYAYHELSFDRFHEKASRTYRVNQTFIWGENDNNQFSSTGPGVASALRQELPEAEVVTSIHTPGDFFVSYEKPSHEVVSFREDKVLAADSNFFRVFDFQLSSGDDRNALKRANTLLMTESVAVKYFGVENPVGKLIRVGSPDDQKTYEVTGILRDLPENTYLKFDVLISMASIPAVERLHWSWVWTQLETYIVLRKDADIENTRAKLVSVPRKYAEETLQRIMNVSYDEYIKSGKKWELFLQPLTEIHLPSTVVYNRLSDPGNKKIVYSMIGAAVFILVLACINFMNLTTAQFTRRVKEASMRKILGLGRAELSLHYFIEALMFCVLALIAAIGLTQLFLPAFNLMTGKNFTATLLLHPGFVLGLLVLVLIMAAFASSYPTFFLTRFHPVEGLKGKLRAGQNGKTFRHTLVVFQFAISILLISCTVVVYQQLMHVSKRDLGFDKENLLVLNTIELVKNPESLLQSAKNVTGVLDASVCTSIPPAVYGGDKFSAEGMNHETFSLNYTSGDEQFISTLGISLLAGRNFSTSVPGDFERVILNQRAVQRIGWPSNESAIGKTIESPGGEIKFEVVGVIKDFNYWSLENPIEPMAIFHNQNKNLFGVGNKKFIALRIAPLNEQSWKKTTEELSILWKVHAGDLPIDYSFVDDNFAETFKTQQQFSSVLAVMASLSMLIAGLGLFGMIIYTLEQRTKEIGIRKVSGASVLNILVLVSKGFVKLIIVSFFVSAPVAYWLMRNWLQDFAYRITPSVWTFAAVGLGTLLIAISITLYHSAKAALANPVNALKDE